jgi:fumarylacetoacetase
MNSTNDAQLRSFIQVKPESPFPIQNLPYGVCRSKKSGKTFICTAIGEYVVNLTELEDAGFFKESKLGDEKVFHEPSLNKFISFGHDAWLGVRLILSDLLSADEPTLRDNDELRKQVFTPMDDVQLLLPVQIGDYTDFYSSEQHARNVGTMFRGPENALKPNWKYLPVGYHGRASSVVVSGTDIHRPQGQLMPKDADSPVFSACKLLDFELEIGFLTGPGNNIGEPIPANEAQEHIFGLVLVNDWSARDIQKWEYVPLGPFLAKNFATSMSPWIVTLDALEPFKISGPKQVPEPLPYLKGGDGWYDIQLNVYLQSEAMDKPQQISRTNARNLYWSIGQQLAHQTITGCNVRPGDLYASGTISGEAKDSYGSLLELSWQGQNPISLPNGEQRTFLEDGDTITMTGYSERDDYRIGFGEVSGKVLAANELKF